MYLKEASRLRSGRESFPAPSGGGNKIFTPPHRSGAFETPEVLDKPLGFPPRPLRGRGNEKKPEALDNLCVLC